MLGERDFWFAIGAAEDGHNANRLYAEKRGHWVMNRNNWESLHRPPTVYGFNIVIDDKLLDRVFFVEYGKDTTA